ncbi:MAG: TIGR00296 family protein [Methanomassiliicoccaceae archaeon]|nr:TIGR00296 family protein [Methanomassiliicoccaceae archaeon]
MDTNDGIAAVRIARNVITEEVTGKHTGYETPGSFNEPRGIFVTINTYPSLHLRGCIGYPIPAIPLKEALRSSAVSACRDPRFSVLEANELDAVVVEVTILTPPEPISVKDRNDLLNVIRIGKDGLMLEYKGRRSVLLPQVPSELGWDVKEYLENLCMKAGIGKNKWKENDCLIHSFHGRTFKETSPNGDITEGTEC